VVCTVARKRCMERGAAVRAGWRRQRVAARGPGGGPVERRVDGEGCPVGRHGARPARAGGGSAHA
jgi:hypothetical protein